MANRTQYTGVDDEAIPANIRRRHNTPEKLQAWVDNHNAMWKTVETCMRCDPPHPLTEREVKVHRLAHIDDTRARQIIGMIQHTKTTERTLREVRDYLATYAS